MPTLAPTVPAASTSEPTTPALDPNPAQTVSWTEFGQVISLTYDPALASKVEAETVPAVAYTPQIMFAEAHPTFARFRFSGYPAAAPFQLPYPLQDAQVMVFQTEDFPGFAAELSDNFASQQQALSSLLQRDLDPALCAQPLSGPDQSLPFLPWLNSQQTFCAQPAVLEFAGGKGIRYLTRTAQGIGPVLEPEVFYTFQGLSGDGKFYISAVFPIQTGIFPTQSPDCPKCADASYNPLPEWRAALAEQLKQLNAQPAAPTTPSLAVLDALVQSIRIETP
jgi:hypothetical protein